MNDVLPLNSRNCPTPSTPPNDTLPRNIIYPFFQPPVPALVAALLRVPEKFFGEYFAPFSLPPVSLTSLPCFTTQSSFSFFCKHPSFRHQPCRSTTFPLLFTLPKLSCSSSFVPSFEVRSSPAWMLNSVYICGPLPRATFLPIVL